MVPEIHASTMLVTSAVKHQDALIDGIDIGVRCHGHDPGFLDLRVISFHNRNITCRLVSFLRRAFGFLIGLLLSTVSRLMPCLLAVIAGTRELLVLVLSLAGGLTFALTFGTTFAPTLLLGVANFPTLLTRRLGAGSRHCSYVHRISVS